MERSGMRNLIVADNEWITKRIIGAAGRNLSRPFHAICRTPVTDYFGMKYNSLWYNNLKKIGKKIFENRLQVLLNQKAA